MNCKKQTIAAVLSGVVCMTSYTVPTVVFAESAETVLENSVASGYFQQYGQVVPAAGNYNYLLQGYQIYLSMDGATRAEVDALYSTQSPFGSVHAQGQATVNLINSLGLDRPTALALQETINALNGMGGQLPGIIVPEEPAPEPEPSPEEPPQEPEQKPETGGNQEPSQNETTPSPENKPTESPAASQPSSGQSAATLDKDGAVVARPRYLGVVKLVGKDKDITYKAGKVGSFSMLPDFSNASAWKEAKTSYNTPRLWGQCTWFAWGRFYEIYGFNPGFSGDGYMCVGELLRAHPDKFELSETPKAGSVFSADKDHNHVGIVLDYDEEKEVLTIQEGNLDMVSNPNWNEAIDDWRTCEVTLDEFKKMYGNVTYAAPIEGKVYTVQELKTRSEMMKPLKELALNKLKSK